jgi:hypothetical protein
MMRISALAALMAVSLTMCGCDGANDSATDDGDSGTGIDSRLVGMWVEDGRAYTVLTFNADGTWTETYQGWSYDGGTWTADGEHITMKSNVIGGTRGSENKHYYISDDGKSLSGLLSSPGGKATYTKQ